MNEQELQILELLSQGKLTVEEANELLASLKRDGAAAPPRSEAGTRLLSEQDLSEGHEPFGSGEASDASSGRQRRALWAG